ncbi:MAG: metallophosphoesterase [Chloroflexota bacterium]|nr:MAG: metallophosphoesterase [Chloroflexota bacterium]
MRFALFSDIHGNLTALRAVAAAIDRAGPLEAVVVAGDLVQGGPRPRETWEYLIEHGWTLLRGNEDEALGADRIIHGEYPPRFRAAAVAQITWTRKMLGGEVLQRLTGLRESFRVATPAGDLLVVHSSPRGTNDRRGGQHNSAREVVDGYAGTGAAVIAFGHFHSNFVRATAFGLLVNVASVGLPLDGQPIANFTLATATSDGWIIEQRQVPYDRGDELAAAARNEMPPWPASEATS